MNRKKKSPGSSPLVIAFGALPYLWLTYNTIL